MEEFGDAKDISKFQKYSNKVLRFIRRPDIVNFVYGHQVKAVMAAIDYFNLNPNGVSMIVLPTGCGKTGVAVLSAYALSARRVLVITPSVTRTEQIGKSFVDRKKSFLVNQRIVEDSEFPRLLPSAVIMNTKQTVYSENHDLMVVVAHYDMIRKKPPAAVLIEDIPRDQYDLVIVDEAHHYSADTWRMLVDHFDGSKRLFLTATPYHNDKPLTDHSPGSMFPICYRLSKEKAVAEGIIRGTSFVQIPCDSEDSSLESIFEKIARRIKHHLDEHDRQDQDGKPHQAMVLAQTIDKKNPAEGFGVVYNNVCSDRCEIYMSSTAGSNVLYRFSNHEYRTLVVSTKLKEGYDNDHVSVIAIVRNVGSRVLFAQFVGRAVRKFDRATGRPDPVTAVVISHEYFKQQHNYDLFDQIGAKMI